MERSVEGGSRIDGSLFVELVEVGFHFAVDNEVREGDYFGRVGYKLVVQTLVGELVMVS